MIIMDTNVLDAALRSQKGASRAIFERVLRGDISAGESTALYLEYEDVLTRKDHLDAFNLSIVQVDKVLRALAKMLEPIHIHYKVRPESKDPDDDFVFDAAVNGQASDIVTFNLKDFRSSKKFGIEATLPRDFVRRKTL